MNECLKPSRPDQLLDFFSPTERALLCDYFDMVRPAELTEVDIHAEPEYGGEWVDSQEGRALEATVAHIALAVIQGRLPQCASVSEGKVMLFRQPFARFRRSVVMIPQHLFTINWADSAPGISWPEAYHVTYIPEFDRYVVTESQDSTDVWGFTDLAIGHFDARQSLMEGCRQVITSWWAAECGDLDQGRWAYVWDEGTISRTAAEAWGDEIWPPNVQEEDDCA